jgi:hypothetical protein
MPFVTKDRYRNMQLFLKIGTYAIVRWQHVTVLIERWKKKQILVVSFDSTVNTRLKARAYTHNGAQNLT